MSNKKNITLPVVVYSLLTFFLFNWEIGSINISLLKISESLNITVGQMQWIMTAYLLSFASLMVAGGKLGDVLGYTRVASIGILIVIIGQLFCTTAGSYPILIMRVREKYQ